MFEYKMFNKLPLVVLMGIYSLTGHAQKSKKALHVDQVSFETYKVGSFRTDDFPDSEENNDRGMAFNLDLGITQYIHWSNRVWTNGNEAKLHTVGWEYDIALRPIKYAEIFHYHHSQHSMDASTRAARFPLRNYYGVRFNFIPN